MERGGAGDMERVASGGEIVHVTGVRAQARAARRAAYATQSPSRDLSTVPSSGEHTAMRKLLQQLLLVSQDLASYSRELGRGMQALLEENTVLRISLQETQNELICAIRTQSPPAPRVLTAAAGSRLKHSAEDEDAERGGEGGERAQEQGREAALRALEQSLEDERLALVRERERMVAESEAARRELQEDRDELARERLL